MIGVDPFNYQIHYDMDKKFIIYTLAAALRVAREFTDNNNHKTRKETIKNHCKPGSLNHAVFEILKGNPQRNRTASWLVKRIEGEGLFESQTDTPAASVVALLKRSVQSGEEYFDFVHNNGKGMSILISLHSKYIH